MSEDNIQSQNEAIAYSNSVTELRLAMIGDVNNASVPVTSRLFIVSGFCVFDEAFFLSSTAIRGGTCLALGYSTESMQQAISVSTSCTQTCRTYSFL